MKDALGHGSDGRGALADRMNRFVGSRASAVERNEWMGSGHPADDRAAAQELARSRPNAAPAPVHPAFGRRGRM